jgi:hypothetical protein
MIAMTTKSSTRVNAVARIKAPLLILAEDFVSADALNKFPNDVAVE